MIPLPDPQGRLWWRMTSPFTHPHQPSSPLLHGRSEISRQTPTPLLLPALAPSRRRRVPPAVFPFLLAARYASGAPPIFPLLSGTWALPTPYPGLLGARFSRLQISSLGCTADLLGTELMGFDVLGC
jgi:hypothetical protein